MANLRSSIPTVQTSTETGHVLLALFGLSPEPWPGRAASGDPPRQKTPGSVRITVEEAAVLQSFPADHPLQGAIGKQYLQVGNAVPPLMGLHALSTVAPNAREAVA